MINTMLREPSDRNPEPPRWQTVIMWAFCGFVGMLLVIGLVQGMVTGVWRL